MVREKQKQDREQREAGCVLNSNGNSVHPSPLILGEFDTERSFTQFF